MILDARTLLMGALLVSQAEPTVIGVAWTLHHEVLFYALASAWIRFPRFTSVAAAVLLLGSGWEFKTFPLQFLFFPLHWEFAAGAMAFVYAPRLTVRCASPAAIFSMLAIVAVCASMTLGDVRLAGWFRVAALAPLFALLVAATTRLESAGRVRRTPLLRLGSALGDSSYTLYLWHIALLTPATKLLFNGMPNLSATWVLLATIVLAVAATFTAHAICRGVEQPLVRVLRAKLSGRVPLMPSKRGVSI